MIVERHHSKCSDNVVIVSIVFGGGQLSPTAVKTKEKSLIYDEGKIYCVKIIEVSND